MTSNCLLEPPLKKQRIAADGDMCHESRGALADALSPGLAPLKASDVGITCFVGSSRPVSAILKHRFLDFLVNEVGRDGQIVHLEDLSRPREGDRVGEPKGDQRRNGWPEEADEALKTVLCSEKIAMLRDLHARGPPALKGRVRHRNDPIPDNERVISDLIDSKEARKDFHQLIREVFGGAFITEAIAEEGAQRIMIMWAQGNDNRDRRSHPRPGSHHKFIHFSLQKRNRETHDALHAISTALNVHTRDLGVAGTKDKRAVTVQRVSLRRGNHGLEEVWQAVNGGGRGRHGARGRPRGRGGPPRGQAGTPCFDLKVGDLSYASSRIELGELGGNHFRLVLRDLHADGPDHVASAISQLRDRGFINYFGMQRFGNSPIGTHIVGQAILQGNFELAASLLLRPRPDDYPEAAEARRIWQDTRDASAALRIMPRNCIAERCLLTHYSKHSLTSHANAISTIPKNLRMMYVHAYQSRLWNIMVSERIRLFGADRAVAGDLVFQIGAETGESGLEEHILPDDGLDESINDENGATDQIIENIPEKSDADAIERLKKEAKIAQVRILGEREAGETSIFDVVLPLAGFLVVYPSGQLGKRYRELLIADGLDPDNLYRKQKEYSMGGVYRKILHRPQNLSYSLIRYDDPDFTLAHCDEDLILKRSLPEAAPDGRYLALKLELTLGSSTYATMALRELLKSETDSRSQKMLTQEMQAKHAASSQEEVLAAKTSEL